MEPKGLKSMAIKEIKINKIQYNKSQLNKIREIKKNNVKTNLRVKHEFFNLIKIFNILLKILRELAILYIQSQFRCIKTEGTLSSTLKENFFFFLKQWKTLVI